MPISQHAEARRDTKTRVLHQDEFVSKLSL